MITSSHNPRIQRIRELLTQKRARENEKAFVVEGVRLLEEALKNLWLPERVVFSSNLSERGKMLIRGFQDKKIDCEEIPDMLMQSLSATEHSQGILGIVAYREIPLSRTLDFILILDNVRDPGNLGTILRTAISNGVQVICLTPGTADAYAPKVVRAGTGAHFRIPLRVMDWIAVERLCHQEVKPPLKILASDAEQGEPIWKTNLCGPVAIVIGSEAEGISKEGSKVCDGHVTIPMPGKTESLNASIAAGILMYETVRQRSQ
jgi:TrmH family RNA methyltransferase